MEITCNKPEVQPPQINKCEEIKRKNLIKRIVDKLDHQLNLKQKTNKKEYKCDSAFNCEKCDYSTNHKINLSLHNNYWHEGKTYSCIECDFKAAKTSSLKQHIE